MSATHRVVFASQQNVVCECGNVALTRFGHDAHAGIMSASSDPTADPLFNPKHWTGTVLSGVIRTQTECAACGREWHEGECR